MKRLTLSLFALFLPLNAFASAEKADQFGALASDLYGQTVALDHSDKAAPAAGFTDAVKGFGETATELGTWIDSSGKAADLGCIFRGMADEANLQLSKLADATSDSDRHAALKRLITMFDDAQYIAAEAATAARSKERLPDAAPACGTVHPVGDLDLSSLK